MAIKRICEAIELDFNRQNKNLNQDIILGPKLAKQPILVPGDSQARKFICLPEKYIYGWLFSIKSDNTNLIEYKEKCYELLYEYFHGTITSRKKFIQEKTMAEREIELLEKKLELNEDYLKLHVLKGTISTVKKELTNLDKKIASEIQIDIDFSINN